MSQNEILDSIRTHLQNPQGVDYCLSGGASGADTLWSQLAEKYADTHTFHFSFEDHKKYCYDAVGSRVIISQERLLRADSSLKLAKQSNRRNFPCRSENVNNLLRRNYYQIVDSQACYAVSRIMYGVVDGGTAWATQMFVDRHMIRTPHDECPCYVYDTITNKWHQWKTNCWEAIDSNEVPTPKGIWTGIGSRDLTPEAIKAMEDLWLRHQRSPGQSLPQT